ncbi:MAG: CpaF family protein, partial [Selenomonadaceae bacterium]|nr:CpaF family protein [Selenomonadaceae bacterium]
MSLLTRLGRTDGRNLQVMIFSSGKKADNAPTEDRTQNLKLMIHRKIVEEISPEEQQILSAKHQDPARVDLIIDKY